jgi:Flp pilus assembly protein TadB
VIRRIGQHHALVAARIEALQQARARGEDIREAARDLAAHHERQTRTFQHERLVHLLVTLFVAGILALAILFRGAVLGENPEVAVVIGVAALVLVLLALTAAYIWHYFRLENQVQRLYELDTDLADLLTPPTTKD